MIGEWFPYVKTPFFGSKRHILGWGFDLLEFGPFWATKSPRRGLFMVSPALTGRGMCLVSCLVGWIVFWVASHVPECFFWVPRASQKGEPLGTNGPPLRMVNAVGGPGGVLNPRVRPEHARAREKGAKPPPPAPVPVPVPPPALSAQDRGMTYDVWCGELLPFVFLVGGGVFCIC